MPSSLLTLIRRFHEWDTKAYTLSGVLKGHDGPINVFSFNSNGVLLASGGDDEQVRIWDISTYRQCQNLMNPQGRWGQITCLKFINLETASRLPADWLCFGTGRGIISIYRKSRRAAEFIEIWSLPIFSAGDSVETLNFDPGQQRLAVGSHYGQIKMLRYQNDKFTELWKDELQDAIPRALLFTDSGRSLNIFSLESGTIICRDAETSAPIATRQLKTAVGHVAQCHLTGNVLVDNMQDGFDLYAPSGRISPIRTYRIETSRMYIKAGVFCEGGKMVACGSDHGRVYVFASGEEQAKQELVHGKRQDLIQAIEATTTTGFHVIVSGTSNGSCDIYVWKKPVKEKSHGEKRQLLEILVVMNVIFLIAFLWATYETWSGSVKIRYVKISGGILKPTSTAKMARRILHGHEYDQGTDMRKKKQSLSLNTPLVQRVMYEVDDQPAERIVKPQPTSAAYQI